MGSLNFTIIYVKKLSSSHAFSLELCISKKIWQPEEVSISGCGCLISRTCLVYVPYCDGTGRWLPSQPYKRKYPQAVASSRLSGTANKLLLSGGINPQRDVWKIRPMPGSKIRPMMRSFNSNKIWGFHQLSPRFRGMVENHILNICSLQPWSVLSEFGAS